MAHDAREVANFILDVCDKKSQPITNLELQKIMFFCHVWSLVTLKKPLIKNNFEAWQHGPVIQYVYRDFKKYKKSPITGRALKINKKNGKREVAKYDFNSQTINFLTNIIDFYSQLGAYHLVKLTHEADGPWDRVWNSQNQTSIGMEIANNAIIEHYSKTISANSLH